VSEPKLVERLRGLESHLLGKIRGQDLVLPKLAGVFCRAALGLTSPERPAGSVLMVGPTGTGKSESFGCACEYVFGPGHLIIIDLSEYQEEGAVAKLLGENRQDAGLLAGALGRTGSGGILFDEIEKAHPHVLDLFLQILWRGCFTDATGREHKLNRYVLGFTSNIGAQEAIRMTSASAVAQEQSILRRVSEQLRPEFLGRLDEQLVFRRLGPNVQREICDLEINRELSRIEKLGYQIEVSDEAREFLVREGFDRLLGARPLRKAVERQLQNAVVDSLLRTGISIGEVVPDTGRSRLVIERRRSRASEGSRR
jgi:ATP-dependent Clp protease ATP-binding subunit ClpA